jgi:UDP-glucose 4-epimerase
MIAVTGASGHLGQWVVARLGGAGHDVLCLSRRPLERPTIPGLVWPRPTRPLACDLTDAASVDRARPALAGVRALIHLAAHIPTDTARNSAADAEKTLQANVLGSIHLLRALGEAERLESLVYASTFEVYGAPRRLPVREDDPTEPTGYYGATKLAAEHYVRLFGEDRQVPCAALRLPAIYGPGDTLIRALGNFIRAAATHAPLEIHGDGSDLRELVYVADAAEAVERAVERRANGVFNVASGTGYSVRQMAEAVQAAAGGASLVHRPQVKRRVDHVLAIDRARTGLGWAPRTELADGVRAQLAWVREQTENPR